jgi:hypothetical protein
MHPLAVDCRFRRVAVFAVSFASLTLLGPFCGGQTNADVYSHGSTTCLQGSDGPGIKLFLMQKNLCDTNAHPYMEIDIRELPVKVQKAIVIGPENWAFLCLSAKEACEQIPSGKIVFDHLENGSTAGLKTEGHYELELRSGVVERGNFKVECVVPCSGQSNSRYPPTELHPIVGLGSLGRPCPQLP